MLAQAATGPRHPCKVFLTAPCKPTLLESTEGRGWSGLCSLPRLQGHSELPALCCGMAHLPLPGVPSPAARRARRWAPQPMLTVAGQVRPGEQPAPALTGLGDTTASVCVSPAWLDGSVGGTPEQLVRARPSPPHTLSGGRAAGCPRPTSLPGHPGAHCVVCAQPRHRQTRAAAPAPSRATEHTDGQ